MHDNDAVILSATRTAVGKFCGGLESFTAPKLGAIAIREAVRRAGVEPAVVDEAIMGMVVQAGAGQNPARQAALAGGLANTVNALTINKVCGSGLKAVMLAAQAVRLGDSEVVVAGGMESMSNCPYLLRQARTGYRLGHGELVDTVVADGLTDVYDNIHMGNLAEFVAKEYGISRAEQDAFAAGSHAKAAAATEAGRFKAEVVPVEIAQKKGPAIVFETDECVRKDSTAEKLAGLRPAFQKDGTVTAGNAPGITDGASALVVTTAARAAVLGVKPMARILGYAAAHREPKWLFLAPVDATRKLLGRLGMGLGDFDLFEYNEAFSVQALACMKDLALDPAKVNVHGGAVAIGHPIGASGARVLTTLLHALRDRGGKRGLASLCLGGGGAVALAVEIID